MRLYIKFYFHSEGKSPLEVVKIVKGLGFTPEVGEFDCSIPFTNPEQYGTIVRDLHKSLKGCGIHYTLTTKER
jgi:hypothetical protein